jgi:hypothetical protein
MELKGVSQLIFEDVSKEEWDIKYLTSTNLDYTIDSLQLIDQYAKKLKGSDLLNQYFDILVSRIGSYLGEVIKRNSKGDFHWYNLKVIENKFPSLKEYSKSMKQNEILYSEKLNIVVLPMYEASIFLKGTSKYKDLTTYAKTVIV